MLPEINHFLRQIALDLLAKPLLVSNMYILKQFASPCMTWIYSRFHVDKVSSAHVYVRMHRGQTIDDISEGLLEDCAQLVKANSIQGILFFFFFRLTGTSTLSFMVFFYFQ